MSEDTEWNSLGMRIIESPYVPEGTMLLGDIKVFDYKPKITLEHKPEPSIALQVSMELRFAIQSPPASALLAVFGGEVGDWHSPALIVPEMSMFEYKWNRYQMVGAR